MTLEKGRILISKLPIRQVTIRKGAYLKWKFSKLPIRQVTCRSMQEQCLRISKLPIRQVTGNFPEYQRLGYF